MNGYEKNEKLRKGLTTGSCSAAAAKAAAYMLLSGEVVQNIKITVRTGEEFILDISDFDRNEDFISCSVVKDSGDDPDITDGITITAKVEKTESGITIDGGEGIGRVTKPGLKISVGNAAINPVPLEMIENEIKNVCSEFNYKKGFHILISSPQGEEIAKKTMNERLGIVGGISILGTTGIVEPMSNQALIDTIKAEIDVNIALGNETFLVSPGNYGRDFAEDELGFDIESAIKCSNFIGETLDYIWYKGVKDVILVGHAGKLVKIAGGVMNTHSKVADGRMEIIAAHCALFGASPKVIQEILDCITIDAAIDVLQQTDIYLQVWESIGKKIGFHLYERTKGAVSVRYIVFTQQHGVLIDSNTNNR